MKKSYPQNSVSPCIQYKEGIYNRKEKTRIIIIYKENHMEQEQSTPKQWCANELIVIAKWHRFITGMLGLLAIGTILIQISNSLPKLAETGTPDYKISSMLNIMIWIVVIAYCILILYGIPKLTEALGKPISSIMLIGMMIPLISLISLIGYYAEIKNILISYNVRVDFMGANKADLERLRTGG